MYAQFLTCVVFLAISTMELVFLLYALVLHLPGMYLFFMPLKELLMSLETFTVSVSRGFPFFLCARFDLYSSQ